MSYVLIKVEPNSSEQARMVLEELQNISAVSEAWATYGYFDVFAVVETENTEGVKPAKECIRETEGVKDTLTLMPYEGFRR